MFDGNGNGIDDYIDFKMSTGGDGGSGGSGGGSGGGGCGCITWIVIVVMFLYVLGSCS